MAITVGVLIAIVVGAGTAWIMLASKVPSFVAPLCLYIFLVGLAILLVVLAVMGWRKYVEGRNRRNSKKEEAMAIRIQGLAIQARELSRWSRLIDVQTIDLQCKGRLDREIVLEYEKSIRQHVQDEYDKAISLGFSNDGIQGLIQNIVSISDLERLSAALGGLSAEMDPNHHLD